MQIINVDDNIIGRSQGTVVPVLCGQDMVSLPQKRMGRRTETRYIVLSGLKSQACLHSSLQEEFCILTLIKNIQTDCRAFYVTHALPLDSKCL